MKPTTTRRTTKLDHIIKALRTLAIPIGSLAADPANVRKHSQRNMDAIRASLERFGQQAPIVYVTRDRRKIVVKGNGLLAAARALGWGHVAAVASGLSGHDATAFAIADNRTSDLSEFDEELLAAQLQELEEAEYDIAAAGFSDAELQELLESVEEPRGRPATSADGGSRKRGERTALFVAGHLKFEIPRATFDRWLTTIEEKVGNDPDRIVAEIKRRLKLTRV